MRTSNTSFSTIGHLRRRCGAATGSLGGQRAGCAWLPGIVSATIVTFGLCPMVVKAVHARNQTALPDAGVFDHLHVGVASHERLREPAQRVADRIDALMHAAVKLSARQDIGIKRNTPWVRHGHGAMSA